MWQLSLPWWEFIIRALIVYGFLLVLLRMTGKRQVGQLAPFDLVLLLVLSNAVQNAMNGGDNSVLAGVLSACTLVLVNYLVGLASWRSKKVEALIEGRPEVLIHNGKLYEEDLGAALDRKSTRLNSSHTVISYAVFCLKKKKKKINPKLQTSAYASIYVK